MENLVSVCIPAFNNGKFIAETIRSVLAQTYVNFEIIIVDDCSTDNTVHEIGRFSDPRIRVYRNEKNLGMHGNWEKALSLATGSYIKLVCGDDIILPRCLELQIAEFNKNGNNDVVIVGSRRKIINADGNECFGSFYKLLPGKYSGKKVMRYCVSFGTNMVGEPMSVLFKASVYRDNKLQLGSNNYLIDLDLYAKLLVNGYLVILKEPLSAFRIYSSSMTGSLGLIRHSRYFNEFISQPWLKKRFGIKWYHRVWGRLFEFNLSLARALVLKLNLGKIKTSG